MDPLLVAITLEAGIMSLLLGSVVFSVSRILNLPADEDTDSSDESSDESSDGSSNETGSSGDDYSDSELADTGLLKRLTHAAHSKLTPPELKTDIRLALKSIRELYEKVQSNDRMNVDVFKDILWRMKLVNAVIDRHILKDLENTVEEKS